MATTPNYKWPTPDDARAFKLGAADMRSLGNAIDTSVKALDTAYKAADSGIISTATGRWNGHGGFLVRNATQATASTSTDVTLAMDSTADIRGTASGGNTLSLNEAGLYVLQASLEVGVGAGGEVSMYIATSLGSALVRSGGTRNGSLRTTLATGITRPLGAGITLLLKYSTNAAMTITYASLSAYRIGAP